MLKADAAAVICSRYGLGEMTCPPQPVSGGLIHRMYRLTTTHSQSAVKVLNPQIMQKPGVRDEFRRSEHIAASFAAANIPAVLALQAAGDPVQEVLDLTVMVYPWCDGEVLSKYSATPEQARQIGILLGRMHTLRLPAETPEGPPSVRKPLSQQKWQDLLRRGRDQGIEWESALDLALPDIFRWDELGREANQMLPQTQVLSHCDLDQKNVIWCAALPFVIDWESVGLTRPAVELIGAALDWSGQSAGTPNKTAFTALLTGYRQEAKVPLGAALPLLQSRLAGWIDWLGACMHRSLDTVAASAEERAAGVRETKETLETMYALAAGMETWAEWYDFS